MKNPFPANAFLTRIFELARHHHRGQIRKGGLPYITHPVAVAKTLRKAGYGDEVVAAALLHDVLEDTGCELEEMQGVAGRRVTRWVTQITDKDKTVAWKARKVNYLKSLRRASREALAVACADKSDNIRCLTQGLGRSGSRFGDGFSGKMVDKIKNYERICRVIRSRYPSCPVLAQYERNLETLKKMITPEKAGAAR